jgi:hypothetical protein
MNFPFNRSGVKIKNVALPVEHGGWSFLLEPIILGLAVAASGAGFFLSIATIGAFLTRHPLKLAISDWRRKRRYPRTVAAEFFVLLFGLIAATGLIATIKTAPSYQFLLPILAAAPFAIVQLVYDAKGQSRALIAELTGSIAMTSVAASIALLGGWSLEFASGLWAVLAARAVPTILYVRTRLSLLHGETASPALSSIMHVAALVAVSALAYNSLVPRLAIAAMLLLFARTTYGFLKGVPATAKKIGISEICFGTITVLAVIIGYHFGF